MLNTGKFSLYSTDTEEQVVSLSRGLDRCAALLKTLLSPEKQGDMQEAQAKGKLAEKLTKRSSNKARQKLTKQSSSPTADVKIKQPVTTDPPPFPGASKHVHHPHACSTPRKNDPQLRHVRSATEPKVVVGELQTEIETVGNSGSDKRQGVANEPPQSVSIDGAVSHPRQLRRKDAQANRRLHVNTERKRHKRSRSADTKKSRDLNQENAFTDGPSSERNAPLNLVDHGLQTCYSSMPNFCPYHHHHYHPCSYVPHCGSQYPTIPLPPPPPLVCPHCAPATHTLPQWPKRVGEERRDYFGESSQRCSSAPGVCTDNVEQPLLPSTTTTKATTAVCGDGSTSSVYSIQLLAEEMLSTLQYSIDAVKKTVGTSGSIYQLESMEHSLRLYCSQLSLQCQKLLLSSSQQPDHPPSPSPSLAHWQAQLQQLEEEKSQLLERLINSETAYSGVKGQLDHSKKRQEALQREIESSGAQIQALKKELEQTNRLLNQLRIQKKAAEEEWQDVQLSAEDAVKRARAENEDLQRQLGILSEELVKSKQDCLKESARVSQTQVSLDRAQDELQLMKLSLSEKETQLLQSQDQYLGLRQCLAYFLSDLRIEHQPSSSNQPRGTYYTVSQDAMKNFQSLVNDGAVDRFLANYTVRENKTHEESQILNLTDTLNESQDFHLQQSSPSCASEASTINASRSQQDRKTKPGVNTLSVITPLQVSDQSSKMMADLELEGTDVASSLLSERDLYLKEERLVEGSSMKSQPRSRQSHDSSTHHTHTQKSKYTHPRSSMELSRGQRVQSPSRSTLSSLQTSVTGTSCRTTASEAEFRSDLASLDADIARLQMQFRVAMLTPLPR